jgi:hypothetical protein
MRWRRDEPLPESTREAFDKLTVDYLRPLVSLLTNDVPKRKAELVSAAVRFMTDPAEVRALYDQLEPLAQRAVQEATHDPQGLLHRDKFIARYGQLPAFHEPSPKQDLSWFEDRRSRPTRLALFFPHFDWLPTDLRKMLLNFVPSPPPFTLPTLAEPPATVRQTWTVWKKHQQVEESEDVPLRVRETAREAEHDLRAVLRLTEAGCASPTRSASRRRPA